MKKPPGAGLDNPSRHIDIASKSLNGFVDAMERLPLRESPHLADVTSNSFKS
jgi:hypothetical protein